jgi:histidinol-phosphate aminotransferase
MTIPTPKPGIMNISPYVGGKSKLGEGKRVIKLSSNENPHGPSPKAVAAYQAQAGNLNRYPDGGHAILREAIAAAQQLPAEQLICGSGSDELIGLLVHAYAGVGDEVLYSEHGFLMYKIYAQSNGATPVTAPEKNLTADIDALLAAVTARTKILFIANPNNPTGTLLPYAEIERLRKGLRADVILALDAAYAEYLDAPEEDGRALVLAGTNTVVFHTFSKIHGLPAIRLGWAFAPAHMIDVMNRVRSPFNVTSPALAAGVEAIADVAYVTEMRTKNAAERARVTQGLTQRGLEVVESHANFVLVKFPKTAGKTAADANAFLLSQGIIVRDVVAYGLPEYLRITIGTAEENTLLLEALVQFTEASAA